jgi:hypothetical protein
MVVVVEEEEVVEEVLEVVVVSNMVSSAQCERNTNRASKVQKSAG